MAQSTRPVPRILRDSLLSHTRRSLSTCPRRQAADPPRTPNAPGASTSFKNPFDQIKKHLAEASRQRQPIGRSSKSTNPIDLLRTLDSSKLQSAHSSVPNTSALIARAQRQRELANTQEDAAISERESKMRRKLGRTWRVGDVYAPRDLAANEQRLWRNQTRRPSRKTDVFQAIGKSPLAFYRNFKVLSEFTNETGQIMHSQLTGLKPKNQRKMAKAIRRSIALGLIPSVHHHPMLLGQKAGIASHLL